jgi:hypothetical protein
LIKPRVFIGSSTEGADVALALARLLGDSAAVQVWTQAFKLGDLTLDTLNRELVRSDYAILVSTSDDVVRSRGTENSAPRDNVIFEAGLFMGRLGPHRTFVVCDRASGLKLPSDWAGLTIATYERSAAGLDASLAPAVEKIADAIATGGVALEVDFLRAYLTLIGPDIRIYDSYAEILSRHFNTIRGEIERLRQNNDWAQLLQLKIRIREYFEYSGRYLDGVEFGAAYVDALSALGRDEEAWWSQVKDIGSLLSKLAEDRARRC